MELSSSLDATDVYLQLPGFSLSLPVPVGVECTFHPVCSVATVFSYPESTTLSWVAHRLTQSLSSVSVSVSWGLFRSFGGLASSICPACILCSRHFSLGISSCMFSVLRKCLQGRLSPIVVRITTLWFSGPAGSSPCLCGA